MSCLRIQTVKTIVLWAALVALLGLSPTLAEDVGKNEDVIIAFLKAADSHDWEQLGTVITPDHLFSMNGYQVRGEQALQDIWRGWWDYAPEFESNILEIIPARDPALVTVLMEVSGPGVVRDGAQIDHDWSFPVAAIVRIHEGRVAEWREFYDSSGVDSIGKE
jgi:limonene-1,2-epoxide hydrolase